MRVLNLYAGIGGNRKLWDDVEVTAVEWNADIANIYRDFFPQDTVIVADAHQYLLEHFDEYDFIWSSPPCPSHSQLRYNIGYKANRIYSKVEAKYPDMKLYEEIIMLMYYFEGGLWVVENTVPYYEPLIPGTILGGHIWWSNFSISDFKHGNRNHRGGTVESLQKRKGFNLDEYPIHEKRKILRNCVEPEVGRHILDCARLGQDYQVATLPLFEQTRQA
jgi:DNA (cytosine-5)-methyltransferase 1